MYGVHIGLNNTPCHIHTVRTALNKMSESDTSLEAVMTVSI